MKKLTKLGLHLPTDPRWVNIAEMRIEDILVDHAYCEQKAASSCISLIVQYSLKEELVKQLSPIVAEEWSHFRRVLKEMEKRGFKLGKSRKDVYVNELLKFQRKKVSPKESLLDKLLAMALIEARSCERFRLLSLHISDEVLRGFYHEFMISEAGHYKMFMGLANHYCGEEATLERWQEFLHYEADLLKTMELRGDRMH